MSQPGWTNCICFLAIMVLNLFFISSSCSCHHLSIKIVSAQLNRNSLSLYNYSVTELRICLVGLAANSLARSAAYALDINASSGTLAMLMSA